MAANATRAAVQAELKSHAEEGASLDELTEILDRRNEVDSLSEDQYHELSLYSWALTRRESNSFAFGENGAWLYEELGG